MKEITNPASSADMSSIWLRSAPQVNSSPALTASSKADYAMKFGEKQSPPNAAPNKTFRSRLPSPHSFHILFRIPSLSVHARLLHAATKRRSTLSRLPTSHLFGCNPPAGMLYDTLCVVDLDQRLKGTETQIGGCGHRLSSLFCRLFLVISR